MKRIVLTVILVLGGVAFLLANPVHATISTLVYPDNAIVWPGWGNGNDDTAQHIGDPVSLTTYIDIDLDTGVLSAVRFGYSSYNSLVTAGDLFIDAGSDLMWDYVVRPTSDSTADIYMVLGSLSSEKGINDDYYIMSDYFFPSMAVSRYREGHPVAVSDTAINSSGFLSDIDDASFTDFNANTNTAVIFADLEEITLTGAFTVGFAPTCANNVVYQSVPEPATMLLLGVGLIGLAGVGRRRFLKKV